MPTAPLKGSLLQNPKFPLKRPAPEVLHDGQPNLPYFFTWANEPWTRKFSGQAGEARKKGREGKKGRGVGKGGRERYCFLCFMLSGFRVQGLRCRDLGFTFFFGFVFGLWRLGGVGVWRLGLWGSDGFRGFGALGGGLEAKGCIGHGIDFRKKLLGVGVGFRALGVSEDFRKKLLGVGVGFRALGVSEVQRVFRVSFSEGLLKHPSTRKALINSCNTYRNTLEHPSNALLEPL